MFEGVRVPVPLPPLAGKLLRLVDGVRTVADLGAAMGGEFAATWAPTFTALNAVNQILLAAPT
jgi:hypothetical protein